MSVALDELRAAGLLSALDEHLARTLCALAQERDERVLLAAALVTRYVADGHVCLPLRQFARGELGPALRAEDDAGAAIAYDWPEPDAWLAVLRASPLCGDAESERTPLVVDERDRVYLRRHFERERTLARQLRLRSERALPRDGARVTARLVHYFGNNPGDLQRTAAELATQRAFCVISGGPGTGKTSTVVKILAVAIEEGLAQGATTPRIALTAPTGKAAVRLESAVRSAKQTLACEPRVRDAIPETSSTIHRLLRSRERRPEPGAQPSPLALDLLVVDEASMVDLELMTELLVAVPESARVILLGDRDQLASVEAGAVLGDICGLGASPAQRDGALGRAVIQLTRSYRYDAVGGIGQLARAVQAGELERALAVLSDPQIPEVTLCEADPLRDPSSTFADQVVAGYRPYLEASDDPAQALARFDRFRVLCAHRRGERGVEAMNRRIAGWLFDAGLLARSEGNYLGRPVLVTENDYRMRLWNGDVGMVARGAQGNQVVCFAAAPSGIRELGIGRLPEHESAFALSVHKSQGSELDEVSLVLPAEPSRILSRELLYTAITRARRRVVIHGSREAFAYAVQRAVSRSTGLGDLLYRSRELG